jgi:hypothetical protein
MLMWVDKFAYRLLLIVSGIGAILLIHISTKLESMQKEAVARNYGVLTNGAFQWNNP